MFIRVIDFETTGMPPDASVVEAAYVDVVEGQNNEWLINSPVWSSVVKPTMPVSAEARAAHHITDYELEGGIPYDDAMICLLHGKNLGASPSVYCAHNADFERAFFSPSAVQWIDTYKCALRLWPDAPRHNNQVLRYHLKGCDPGLAGMPPHRALPDCHTTALILIACLKEMTVVELISWSKEPPLLPRVPMGKHKGKKWGEVPTDYLHWAAGQEFDEGVAFAVKTELARR